LWNAQVDRVQIGQLLLSLYMNAAEAMPGGGDLYLQSENVVLDENQTRAHDAAPGRFIKIAVTDSGPGLDEEAKQRIFEPFYSAFRTTRYDGLGLAAAYGTIKSHKGLINVYSEKGHGTTFTIYLPASQRDMAQAPDMAPEVPKGSETILLVDDHEHSARAGREILERYGYKVMVAASGSEAIEIYTDYNAQIDLVLLDIILPDTSAEEVFHTLKQLKPDIIVVLTSGYSVNKKISALLSRGCADFVQKPFQIQSLPTKVRLALDVRAPRAAGGLDPA
ncbi:MAG: response regulator, partial [Desulfosarcinaceae bacterium]